MAGNRASCTRRQRLAKWPHAPVVARCSHGCNSAVVPPAIATLTQVRSDGRRSGGRRGAGLQGTTGAAGRKLPTAGTVDLEVPVHQSVLPTPYILRDEESTIRAHLRATGVPASRQAPTRFRSEGSTFAVAERSVLCRAIGISGTAPGTTCGNHRANYPRHPGTSRGIVFAVQVDGPTRRGGRNRCRIPPYKREAGGSNPPVPTDISNKFATFRWSGNILTSSH